MKLITNPAEFPQELGQTAITIGKFDGMHFGHRQLVSTLLLESHRRDLASVVVTFDRHPLALFAPEKAPQPIVSLAQKRDLIATQNVDATVQLAFTRELSKLTPLEFVRDLLVGQLGMALIVIGRDFNFGHRGAGDVDFLVAHAKEYEYEIIVVDDEVANGRRASSTWVRECLDAGDVENATEVLGRQHVLRGDVIHGAKRGRELGFPTANLDPGTLEGLIPADGVYAGWFSVDGKSFPTAISIGNNPTFEGVPQRQVEAHVIDQEGLDLYGDKVEVSFVRRLRGMVSFSSLDALVEQMQHDVDETRLLLS